MLDAVCWVPWQSLPGRERNGAKHVARHMASSGERVRY